MLKSLTDLWCVVADELATWCHTSATKDCKKVLGRVEHEGMSFLTITLPSFGKEFERVLDRGYIDASSFAGFQHKGGLPLFLGGFLRRVFDTSSLQLLDEPCIDSIFAIRELCSLFAKIEIPCSDDRETRAMLDYIKCEKELGELKLECSPELAEFKRISSLLFADVFSAMEDLILNDEITPRHGPGKTADRLLGNEKYDQLEWPSRLDTVFPYGVYGIASWGYNYLQSSVKFLEPWEERPVKVVSVPKTLKTPRIIAIEPTCMQYMQQGLLTPMVRFLESKVVPGNTRSNLAHSFVGFSDQAPNRDLARQASKHGDLATLDLSEASDRVSNSLVLAMLERFPLLSEAVQATRSTHADVLVRDQVINLELNKFASMGSALCFPMEAMVFATAIFMGIQKKLNCRLDRKQISRFRGQVRVYGDDLLVPVDCVDEVTGTLARLGFKVNSSKSFWTGKFRESCGGDYYDGVDVTPIRFRRRFPSSLRDVSEVISLVEFRNHAYSRGLWKTARYLDDRIVPLLRRFPIVEDTSPALGRKSFLPYQTERLHASLHRPMVKAMLTRSRPPMSYVSGEGALLKCLLHDGIEPIMDPRHLERQGRPQAVDIKLAWVPPY